MKKIVFMLTLLVSAVGAEAKYWKIGPSSVIGMDFASINDAMSSSDVTKGDTLYLDQYYNESAEQTVTKKVVIIGTGYDTSFTDEQVVARLNNHLHLKADGVVVKSVRLSYVYFYNDECIMDRCYANYIKVNSTEAGYNHIYSSYIEGSSTNMGAISGFGKGSDDIYYKSKLDIQNNIIYCSGGGNSDTIKFLESSIVNNNVIHHYLFNDSNSKSYYSLDYVSNSIITNNYIYGYSYGSNSNDLSSTVIASGSGNTIEHNILSRSASLSYYPQNKVGYSKLSSIFKCSGNYSNYYKLSETSPAKGYATDGGEVGCHGGMFGCPSGGRPQYIPYFTKVTVGSRSEDGKLPVSVTIKIQDE